MIGSETNVVLDSALSKKDAEKITKDISKMKGVFSAHFNAKAKTIYVHYSGLDEVCEEIKKIKGVTGFNRDGLHYRG
ncbi:MAG: hypothetical protein ACAH80_07885 [Alphaproteobacteria bacterium]